MMLGSSLLCLLIVHQSLYSKAFAPTVCCPTSGHLEFLLHFEDGELGIAADVLIPAISAQTS